MGDKPKLTEEENKAVGAMSWIGSFYLLINGLLCCFFQAKGKLGFSIIYINSILPILLTLITVIYVVYLIKNRKKLRVHKGRYILIGFLLVFQSGVGLTAGSYYMRDIASGTKTVSTRYFHYNISKARAMVYPEDGSEEFVLYLSKAQVQYMEDNKSPIDKSEKLKISDNLSAFGHKQGFTFEYYPNSRTVKSINVNQ